MAKVRGAIFSNPAVDAPLSFVTARSDGQGNEQSDIFSAVITDEDGTSFFLQASGLDLEDAGSNAAESVAQEGRRVKSIRRGDFSLQSEFEQARDVAINQAFQIGRAHV